MLGLWAGGENGGLTAGQSRAPVELCECGLSAASGSIAGAAAQCFSWMGPGWAQGHSACITFVCWPWAITFSANNSQNLRVTRLLHQTAWFPEETWRSFLLFPTAYYGELAVHVDRWRGVTGVSCLLPYQHCIMILGFLFSAASTNWPYPNINRICYPGLGC